MPVMQTIVQIANRSPNSFCHTFKATVQPAMTTVATMDDFPIDFSTAMDMMNPSLCPVLDYETFLVLQKSMQNGLSILLGISFFFLFISKLRK